MNTLGNTLQRLEALLKQQAMWCVPILTNNNLFPTAAPLCCLGKAAPPPYVSRIMFSSLARDSLSTEALTNLELQGATGGCQRPQPPPPRAAATRGPIRHRRHSSARAVRIERFCGPFANDFFRQRHAVYRTAVAHRGRPPPVLSTAGTTRQRSCSQRLAAAWRRRPAALAPSPRASPRSCGSSQSRGRRHRPPAPLGPPAQPLPLRLRRLRRPSHSRNCLRSGRRRAPLALRGGLLRCGVRPGVLPLACVFFPCRNKLEL